MNKKLGTAIAAIAMTAGSLLAGAPAANADPSYSAGCNDYSYHIQGTGLDSFVKASGDFAIRACWSGGSFTNNRITMETSNVTWVNGFGNQVDSVAGPLNSSGLQVQPGEVVGTAGSADLQFRVKINSGIPWKPVSFQNEVRVYVHLEPGRADWSNTE
jgi:hypothetical protein